MITSQKPPGQKPPGQKHPENKLPRIIEEIIAKYAVDAITCSDKGPPILK